LEIKALEDLQAQPGRLDQLATQDRKDHKARLVQLEIKDLQDPQVLSALLVIQGHKDLQVRRLQLMQRHLLLMLHIFQYSLLVQDQTKLR
jgi:hypothetical protein